jgi:hypothetical protein
LIKQTKIAKNEYGSGCITASIFYFEIKKMFAYLADIKGWKMNKKTGIFVFTLILSALFLATPSSALQPLSEDELYDTSGQATPTVSIKYSDELTVDYFNQNVFIFEPLGEQYGEISSASWIDTDSENALVLNWKEPARFVFEFDKHQYYPEGIYVSVSDIFETDATGRILPEYEEFESIPTGIIPPNTTYLRTWSSATTVTLLSNTFDIALTGTVYEYDEATGRKTLKPDIEQAEDPGNILMSVYWASKTRTEILGYIYLWAHD